MRASYLLPLFAALGVFFVFAFKFYSLSTGELVSPIVLTNKPELVTFVKFPYSSDLWFPQTSSKHDDSGLKISAKSAFVVDISTGQVLYSKNEREKLPVASTVKILTAGIALERKKSEEIITVSENAAKIGEDFMGLTAHEKITLENLLYGLLLPSGNDVAEAIAEGISGSREGFVKLMNEKTQILGARDSKFVNPSGLEGDGEHYSTAYDLALISRWTWVNFPLFRRVVGTKYYEIPYEGGLNGDSKEQHKYFYLENQTNLLGAYPGVRGIKPGYTPEAGLCLVTIAERGGHEVLGVILGSNDRRGEMEQLLDYSFSTLGIQN